MKRTRRTPLFIRTYQDDESERYHKQQRRSKRDMESRTHSHTDERRRIVGEHRVVTVTNTGDEKSSGDDERRVGHSGNETRMKDRRRSTQATDLYGSHSLWLRFRRCHPHLPIVGGWDSLQMPRVGGGPTQAAAQGESDAATWLRTLCDSCTPIYMDDDRCSPPSWYENVVLYRLTDPVAERMFFSSTHQETCLNREDMQRCREIDPSTTILILLVRGRVYGVFRWYKDDEHGESGTYIKIKLTYEHPFPSLPESYVEILNIPNAGFMWCRGVEALYIWNLFTMNARGHVV